MPYKPTKKQAQAWALLREGPRNVMLVGGSRSGKTTVTMEEIFCRATYFPGSRHLVARLRFSHAKASLWMDTIPKLMEMEGLNRKKLRISDSGFFIQFPNKSEIWVDGLDDKDRVDKILGREYATIYFNECSEMSYDTISTVMTRLAQNIEGCVTKAYHDLNPVSRLHWGHKIFEQKISPENGELLPNPEDYGLMYLQPEDNRKNLPPGYIEQILDTLPSHKRRRFRYGQWGEPEGVVFPDWVIIDTIPEEVRRRARRSHGLDFGFSVDPAALIDIYLLGDDLYLDELIYETELTNPQLSSCIKKTGAVINPVYADSSEPKSIAELSNYGIPIKGAAKGADSIRQGIDWLLSKNIHVTRRSYNLQGELQNYLWQTDRTGRTLPKPVDDHNHGIDATRYGCEPFMRSVPSMRQTRVRGLV